MTVWAILIGGTCHNLVLLGTDQVAIQRYMTATSLKAARRSMWLKLVISLPAFSAFYLTGPVLFAFLSQRRQPIPWLAGQISKADQILPYFVVNELPSGLPGLLIAGNLRGHDVDHFVGDQFAHDGDPGRLLQAFVASSRSLKLEQLRLARKLTLGYGVLIVALAFAAGRFGSLIEVPVKLFGLIGGPLLGLFSVGNALLAGPMPPAQRLAGLPVR